MPHNLLFAYGTLRQPEVQMQLFGRRLEQSDDALPGFRLEPLAITDAAVIALSGSSTHQVLRRGRPEEIVRGLALSLSDDELAAADRYEVSDYARTSVTLASGREAFVYVHRYDL